MAKKKKLTENEIIKEKINHWEIHLELDKHNLRNALSIKNNIISSAIAIFIGFVGFMALIIKGLPYSLVKIILLHILFVGAIIIIFIGFKKKKKWDLSVSNHNKSFMARDKQIRELYHELCGKNIREELDIRHEQIKNAHAGRLC